jgi:glycosyltransferase involved in cell wall biosynthesis
MNSKFNIKVSVLVVNYNNSKYINKCIYSLLNQDYQNIEIIFLDDNSSDNSNNIIKKFKKKIKIIKKNYRKQNVGAFDQIKSFKECFKISTGKLIFLLDSDDYFHKTKISKFVNKFKEKKRNIVCDMPILKFPKYEKKVKIKKSFFNNYWPYLPPTSCIAIDRKVFKKLLVVADKNHFSNIWLDFRIGILAKYVFKKYYILNNNLTYYRQSNNNVSSNFKHLSKNWWIRRYEAHSYVTFVFDKYKIKYRKNFDFFLTKFMNYFF